MALSQAQGLTMVAAQGSRRRRRPAGTNGSPFGRWSASGRDDGAFAFFEAGGEVPWMRRRCDRAA